MLKISLHSELTMIFLLLCVSARKSSPKATNRFRHHSQPQSRITKCRIETATTRQWSKLAQSTLPRHTDRIPWILGAATRNTQPLRLSAGTTPIGRKIKSVTMQLLINSDCPLHSPGITSKMAYLARYLT